VEARERCESAPVNRDILANVCLDPRERALAPELAEGREEEGGLVSVHRRESICHAREAFLARETGRHRIRPRYERHLVAKRLGLAEPGGGVRAQDSPGDLERTRLDVGAS